MGLINICNINTPRPTDSHKDITITVPATITKPNKDFVANKLVHLISFLFDDVLRQNEKNNLDERLLLCTFQLIHHKIVK